MALTPDNASANQPPGGSTQKLLEAVPPHDAVAEASVLGAMLIDPDAAAIASEQLIADDFYVPRHRTLFFLFSELSQKHENLDEVFAVSELRKRGKLEEVGGVDVIGKLIVDTPGAANVETYCRLVRDRARERQLIEAAGRILKMVHEPGAVDGEELVENAEKLVYEIADKRSTSDAVSMTSIMAEVLTESELHHAARMEGRTIPSRALPTHFVELDQILSGGFWPGELVIVAGRPSMGKTTFALNIARKIAVMPPDRAKAVAIFSMEMPNNQVAKNILCADASHPPELRITGQKMRRYEFTQEEFAEVQAATKALQDAPIYIDDTSALSMVQLRARCRRLKHRYGIRLVIVDYLQLMRTVGSRSFSREQEVAELSRNLKALARELDLPVIVLSQLNRSMEKRDNEDKRPQLSDLRDSGAIEQDADVVIMLYREEYYDAERNAKPVNIGEAMVQKNRNGQVGKAKLTFFKDILRFESYSPEHDHEAGD